ncbi:hypothetical protein FHS26_000510 [Rhizobium pisi]|uniref:Uncharacterized protein n=1 Tax=Rhizobium pisi TaxID=574561 RepID=A0A7W5FXM3_9HYPH|nr:hypothetical protein [Rhizobium pisi]
MSLSIINPGAAWCGALHIGAYGGEPKLSVRLAAICQRASLKHLTVIASFFRFRIILNYGADHVGAIFQIPETFI